MISEKQKKILAFSFTKYDGIICDGAIRAGKTCFMSIGFIDWAMREFNESFFAICGKTIHSVIRNVIRPLLSIKLISEKYNVNLHLSENYLEVQNETSKNTFYFFGGKDESSASLIQGITLSGILLDEVALMPKSFVDQALARCSVEGSKFWFNCNPKSPDHWFYKEFILKHKEKNIMYLHFSLEDNPSLTPDIIKRYKSMYTGVFYDRYIRGLWVDAEGLVFRRFADNPEMFTTSNPEKNVYSKIVMGIDFGGNGSQTTFAVMGYIKNYEKLILIEENQMELSDNIDSDKICKIFIEFYTFVLNKYGRIDYVFCDSASTTLINSLRTSARKAGYRYGNIAGCKKNPIKERPPAIDLLFGTGRLFISEHCINTKKALSALRWDEKNPEIPEDKNEGNINDIYDAFCYTFIDFLPYILKN